MSLTFSRTRIISAFPGMGKTYLHEQNPSTTLDSDSSNFSWIEKDGNKERNPDFPNNYIEHIKENIGKYDFIFISSHKEVRDALIDNCLMFYMIFPDPSRKDEFIERYRKRGNDDSFIELVENHWNDWVNAMPSKDDNVPFIPIINKEKYLGHELRSIVISEGESYSEIIGGYSSTVIHRSDHSIVIGTNNENSIFNTGVINGLN